MKKGIDTEKMLREALVGMSCEEFIRKFNPSEPEYIPTHREIRASDGRKSWGLRATNDPIMLDRGNTRFLRELCETHKQRPGIVLNALVTAARLDLPYEIMSGQAVSIASSMAMKELRESESIAVSTYHAKLQPKPIEQVHWAHRTNAKSVQIMCAPAWFPKSCGIKFTYNKNQITCEECIEAERSVSGVPKHSGKRAQRWVQMHTNKARVHAVDSFEPDCPNLGDSRGDDDAPLSAADLGLDDGNGADAGDAGLMPVGGRDSDAASAGSGQAVPNEVPESTENGGETAGGR